MNGTRWSQNTPGVRSVRPGRARIDVRASSRSLRSARRARGIVLFRHDDSTDTLVTRGYGAEMCREARDESVRSCRYFVFPRHMPVGACQSPPAAWQSAWLVIVDSTPPVPVDEPDGLADGEEPVEGADMEPLLEPEPVAPVLPLLPVPLLEPAAPGPLPAPPPAAPPPAATIAGANVIIPIKSRVSIFFIRVPPCSRVKRSAAGGTKQY